MNYVREVGDRRPLALVLLTKHSETVAEDVAVETDCQTRQRYERTMGGAIGNTPFTSGVTQIRQLVKAWSKVDLQLVKQ